jgi:hypothetical protein
MKSKNATRIRVAFCCESGNLRYDALRRKLSSGR